MTARKIDFYLTSSTGLRRLADESRRATELQQVLLRTAPEPLAQACRVKQLRAETLLILAENAAVAAKLKQLFPRLITSYRKQGWKITSIRVDVQVREAAPQREIRRLSTESIENLERAAAGFGDSPMKQALISMVAHQRRKN